MTFRRSVLFALAVLAPLGLAAPVASAGARHRRPVGDGGLCLVRR